ncbi:transcriptional regulator [Peribacillus asahii]|uniref:transcriptional regulator n=1 Tax=Peribacillus asahii TaxID=228899 RepID=UPI002079F709|nr:transcriptional regulator [Peribacillus asahii]USK58150.1 transcriptional regulator [Peribacillus asahii]
MEYELYSYHDTLKEIQFLRNNIMFTKENDDENVGGGRSSLPSSPTEQIGVRLETHKKLNNLEEIAEAIEKVYNIVNDDYKKLIRLKYWTRPQTKTWEGIAAELHISRRQVLRWRDQIIQAVAEVLGWR